MKLSIRILLCAMAALMILALPFAVPSGSMLEEYQDTWADEAWDSGLIRWLVPTANAEEAQEETSYALPIDFSAGMQPNPDAYTEDGYQDDSLTIRMETREEDGVIWRIGYVQIKDASQLRTGIAGSKATINRSTYISAMAKEYHAVLAINGDYFADQETKKTYEIRMGETRKAKTNKKKDILFIDENGDFHLFIKSNQADMDAFKATGLSVINAFTFGPALVKDGQLLNVDKEYGYNPNGKEPRMAIGQVDKLTYVVALAEGRSSSSNGVTQQALADFMFNELHCTQAYNLDGGNSATMIFNGEYYQTGRTIKNERQQSDFIYFATAVDPETWSK